MSILKKRHLVFQYKYIIRLLLDLMIQSICTTNGPGFVNICT